MWEPGQCLAPDEGFWNSTSVKDLILAKEILSDKTDGLKYQKFTQRRQQECSKDLLDVFIVTEKFA